MADLVYNPLNGAAGVVVAGKDGVGGNVPVSLQAVTIRNEDGTAGAIGGGGTSSVQGNVGHATTDSGNPVKVGGYGSFAVPAAVTTGQRVNAWYGLNGQAFSVLTNTTGNQSASVLSAVGDGSPVNSGLVVWSQNQYLDPATSTLTRARGDTIGGYVVSKGGANIVTNQVNVGTSATLVVAARTGRQKVTLTSTSAVVFYVGGATVTAANGLYVAAAAGASVTLDTAAAVYAVGGAAVTISYAEFY